MVISQFQEMFNHIGVAPKDIEGIADMRDYMQSLIGQIDGMTPTIDRNDGHFKLLELTHRKLPLELMDFNQNNPYPTLDPTLPYFGLLTPTLPPLG